MKKSMFVGVLLLALLVLLVTACTSAVTPTSTSAPAVSDTTSAASDDEVKALIEERCGSCHNTNIIYNANYDEGGWSSVIDQMIQKGANLSESEKALLIDWLISQP